jgi:tripartite-type tricarboxylate transporter receptor subunit TctC
MRALVTSTPARLKDFPNVPTAKEEGIPNLEKVMGWSGLYGPPGLPAEVVEKWQTALKEVAKNTAWLNGNDTVGAIPAIRSPADTEAFAKEQFDLYSKLGADLNLKK